MDLFLPLCYLLLQEKHIFTQGGYYLNREIDPNALCVYKFDLFLKTYNCVEIVNGKKPQQHLNHTNL